MTEPCTTRKSAIGNDPPPRPLRKVGLLPRLFQFFVVDGKLFSPFLRPSSATKGLESLPKTLWPVVDGKILGSTCDLTLTDAATVFWSLWGCDVSGSCGPFSFVVPSCFELDNVDRCRSHLVPLLGPGCQSLINEKRVYDGLFMLGRAIVF